MGSELTTVLSTPVAFQNPREYTANLVSGLRKTNIDKAISEGPAGVNQRFAHGETALMMAAAEGQVDKCRTLLELGADPNLLMDLGLETALIQAADKGDPSVCALLVQGGANVNFADDFGQTALSFAAACGHTAAIVALFENGADLNIADGEGNTPLHKACRPKKLEAAQWLAERMTREAVLQRNTCGHTAVQVWGLYNYEENELMEAGHPTGFVEMEDGDKAVLRAQLQTLVELSSR